MHVLKLSCFAQEQRNLEREEKNNYDHIRGLFFFFFFFNGGAWKKSIVKVIHWTKF